MPNSPDRRATGTIVDRETITNMHLDNATHESGDRRPQPGDGLIGRVLLASVALVASLAVGCSDSSGGADAEGDGSAAVADDGLICGLVSADLVSKVTGESPIDTFGEGFADDGSSARCSVVDARTNTIVMQLSIARVDPDEWAPKLEQEESSSSYGDCTTSYDGDPGVGHGCTYEGGIWRFGAAVHALADRHLIRATVYNWDEATPEQRLALAEDVASEVDQNFTAHTRDDD